MLYFDKATFKSVIFSFIYSALVCASLLLPAVSAFGADIRHDKPPGRNEIGIITALGVNVWPEPGYEKPPLGRLKSGASVKIADHVGQWLKIVNGGKIGYIINDKKNLYIIHRAKNARDNKKNAESVEKQAENIANEIKKSMDKIDDFVLQETDVIEYLNKTDQDINAFKKKIAVIKSDMAYIAVRIEKSGSSLKTLKKEFAIYKKSAAERLVALYKLNCLGSLQILASSASLNEIFYRRIALKRLLANDEKILENFARSRARLSEALASFNEQKKKKLEFEYALKNKISEMFKAKRKKEFLLKKIRMEKAYKLSAVKALNRAATNLNVTIKSFGYSQKKSYIKKNKRMNFNAYKGFLKMPVKGKIISRFGPYKNEKFNIENFRSGIEIKSNIGEPISSVFVGHVLYSTWFKGYGNIIIIDHGNNYYTLYAHLEKLFKKKGDKVKTGEVIATVGDSGSIVGAGLYFEVRHHGKPMDPMQWIKKS